MKKYFIVSDVHSFYVPMKEALDEAGFDYHNPDHIFVSLGDLLDRGEETVKCLQFVNSLPKERKILIRGNHEDLLDSCIDRGYYTSVDYHNGTAKTCDTVYIYEKLRGNDEDEWSSVLKESSLLNKYLSCLKDYAQVGNNIFTHAWVPWECANGEVTYVFEKPEDGRHVAKWTTARWENPFDMWKVHGHDKRYTLFCGHWHTSWAHSKLHKEGEEWGENARFEPFEDDGIVGMDACTAYSGKVNCCVLEAE